MRLRYIAGREIIGFFGIFEQSYGDPETERPMRTITPSTMHGITLPFRCPRCGDVSAALACPVQREHYRDTRSGRDNYFCPSCGCRFKIDPGEPLAHPITPGALAAPAKVTRDGVTTWLDNRNKSAGDNTMIGYTNGYTALAHSTGSSTVVGAILPRVWRALTRTTQRALPQAGDAETFSASPSNPLTRVVINPPKGASTVFAAPRRVTVRGGTRSVPPSSFSANTVYYSDPQAVTVTASDGSVVRITTDRAKFVQIYGGQSSRA